MADRARAGLVCSGLLLALVVPAGCGSSGPSAADTFKAGYAKERTALNARSQQIGDVITTADGKTDAQLVSEIDGVEGRYSAELTRLEALKPPDALKAGFATLTTAARVLDADLRSVSAAAGAHDAAAAEAATKQLVAHVPALQTAAEAMRKKLGLKASATAAAPAPTTSTVAQAPAEAGGRISVDYDPPSDAAGRFAKEILRLGGTDGVAAGLTHSFVLPTDLRIHAVNGVVGPHYDPQAKTITVSYGFVNYTAKLLKANFPELRRDDTEFGRELAAVDGFLLMHEFGHALIDAYALPVLGREEDAADSVATVFLTTSVEGGAQYAFDAARFFHALSARQRHLAPSDYFDEHSLDEQRALSIVCWIGGSSPAELRAVKGLGLLSSERLQRCPAEYAQKVRSWQTLIAPHVRPS